LDKYIHSRFTNFSPSLTVAMVFRSPFPSFFRPVCEIAKSDYYLGHVCLSVCMEKLGSHWTGFSRSLIFGYFSRICREN
jgi:hypothetical protein